MNFRGIKKKRIVSIILLLMLSLNLTAFADEDYSDVAEKDYFFVSVGFATEKGIINGTGNGRFSPWDNLTIAEAIKISACIHANFYEEDIHPRAGSEHWADVYHNYAVENGIIDETDFSEADFDNTITRDRLFFILANTLPDSEYIAINETELAPQKSAPDYVEKLFCAGIVTGNENGFDLENNITRADCSLLISRMCAYSQRRIVF